MGEKRTVQRVSCFSKCSILHNGSHYVGVLENISLNGALVAMADALPYVIRIGDTCQLCFSGNPELCLRESVSTVVRICTPRVGLQFVKEQAHPLLQ